MCNCYIWAYNYNYGTRVPNWLVLALIGPFISLSLCLSLAHSIQTTHIERNDYVTKERRVSYKVDQLIWIGQHWCKDMWKSFYSFLILTFLFFFLPQILIFLISINFHSKNSNKPQIYLSTQKKQTRARFFGQSKLEKAPKFFTFVFSRLLGYRPIQYSTYI